MSLAVADRSGRWLAEPGLGVYVHIPFCQHRCHYCDFNTYEGLDALHGPYVEALLTEIARCERPEAPAVSVFFGGGTPTLLRSEALVRVLAAIDEHIGIAPDAEITVEANPETVDEGAFEALLAGGFNRFSIGVQSLVPDVLVALGRTHSFEVALEAIAAARRAGATDVSADLIYGSPWETPVDWERSLHGIIAADVDHISAYALTVEAGTPLDTMVSTGRVPDVDPDQQADRFETTERVLGAAGYARYEVSNWARPNRASRHNLVYWSAGDYLAFGAGAHGHLDGLRWWNVRLPRDYIDRIDSGASTQAGEEKLDRDARTGEAIMLGLRLTSGFDLADLEARFGSAPIERRRHTLDELADSRHLVVDGDSVRVHPSRAFLVNEASSRLL